MIIELHGQFKDKLKSEIQTHEEHILIKVALTENENTYYLIEEAINKIVKRIEEINNTYKDIQIKKKQIENIDEYKKERKKILQKIEEAEKYLIDYKRKESHTSIETEQYNIVKKTLQELEADLYYLEEEIKEIETFRENENYIVDLKNEAKKLETKYYDLADEKLKIIKKIQKQENKIQSIEFLVKTLSSRGGYEVLKSQSAVKEDYYKLYRRYDMKDGETREYEQEFYTLKDFLEKFKISTEDISEAKVKENKLKKLRQKKRLEKSGLNKIMGGKSKRRKGSRVGGKSKRNLRFENPEIREEIIEEINKLKQIKEEEIQKIKNKLYEAIKDKTEIEQKEILNEYKMRLEEEKLKRYNPEEYKRKKELETLHKEMDKVLKDIKEKNEENEKLEEQLKKEKEEIEKIKKEEERQRKLIEEKEKEIARLEAEEARKREERENTVIAKITKPIKGFFNKIKSIFK